LPDSGRPTGLFKHPLTGAVQLGSEGFAGDQQADRRVHGGPEKAVHLYPAVHYARLAAAFPALAGQLVPGSLGENISSPTLDEAQVHIGQRFRLGDAVLQVCQPRNPCWKIDARFAVDGLAAFIAENRLTGWYFRVLQAGRVAPDATLEAAGPPPCGLSLAAALQLWQAHRPSPQALRDLAATPGIASGWRQKISERADWLARQSAPTSPPPAAPLQSKTV
jgi:MOSC domain-containing protein YiiM